jgi:alkylation response protein AidB-like acyl-CoA dehydrogenase
MPSSRPPRPDAGSGGDDPAALRAAAVDFGRGLNDDLAARDREGRFPAEEWRACAEFGIQALAVPAEQGGAGARLGTVMAVMEGLGLGCEDNGLLFSLNAQMWSVQHPLVRFGSEEQRTRYLPALVAGDLIGAHGMTEPGSGSDAFSLATRAVRDGGAYVLNGRKTFITNAPVAGVAVVFATIDPELGVGGVTAFLVDMDNRGIEVDRTETKMGMRTSPMGDLVLTDCRLPESARLGREGGGAAIFNSSMEWERGSILSGCTGAMERELSRAVDYARSRHQFGEPIGRFPAVAERLADMKVRLEASHGLLRRVAELIDEGRPAALEAAIAKLYVSEAWVASSLDAQSIYGAWGYTVDNGIERQVRDSLASRIYSGTSDIQRLMIARRLGL